MNRVYEGAEVWCSGSKESTENGWAAAREVADHKIQMTVHQSGIGSRFVTMNPDQAERFGRMLIRAAKRQREGTTT